MRSAACRVHALHALATLHAVLRGPAGPRAALAGQAERGRVVAPASFARHWRRWQAQHDRLPASAAAEGWAAVHVVDRTTATATVRRVVSEARQPGPVARTRT